MGKREMMAQTMRSRQKRNKYTQSSNRNYFFGYPTEGKDGYSDCSSAVRESIRRVSGIEIGSNTVAQVNNSSTLEWREFANGAKYPTGELLPGDLLYFKGTNASRPYKVGHVEMVDEDTAYLVGHGSGTGPRRIQLRSFCASRYSSGKGLIGVKRVVLPDDDGGSVPVISNLGKRILKRKSPLMRGEDVRELQSLLLQVGYDSDGIDGVYGINSISAVKGFQHASKLTVDGEYGPLTHAALQALLEEGDEEQTETGGGNEPQMVMATGDCWIRTNPSTAAQRNAVLYKGSMLEESGEDTQSWQGVLYNGKQRYVSKKYTKIVAKDSGAGLPT